MADDKGRHAHHATPTVLLRVREIRLAARDAPQGNRGEM